MKTDYNSTFSMYLLNMVFLDLIILNGENNSVIIELREGCVISDNDLRSVEDEL